MVPSFICSRIQWYRACICFVRFTFASSFAIDSAVLLSLYRQAGSGNGSLKNFEILLAQIMALTASVNAQYSASLLLSVTSCCRLDTQINGP